MITRTKKIFVGGLSASTTIEDVKKYFQQFGAVSTLKHFFSFFNLCSKYRILNLKKIDFLTFETLDLKMSRLRLKMHYNFVI